MIDKLLLWGINCFAPRVLHAITNPYILGSIPLGGTGCDACSGDLLFSMHFENSDDVTAGNPCGCSVGDTTISRTGTSYSTTQKSDGTYSLFSTSENQYVSIDNTNMTNLKTTGTYFVDVYHTRAGPSRVFTFTSDVVIMGTINYNAGGNTIVIAHGGNNKSSTYTFANSTWTRLGFSWDASPADGNEKLAVKVGTNPWEETNHNLTDNTSDPSLIILGGVWQYLGGYYDNLKIYSSYKATET